MIATAQEYDKTKDELVHLEQWLARLQQTSPLPAKGLTKAGVRKMIARLHEGTRELDAARIEPDSATRFTP